MKKITRKFRSYDKALAFRGLFENQCGMCAKGVKVMTLHYDTMRVTVEFDPKRYVGGRLGVYAGAR